MDSLAVSPGTAPSGRLPVTFPTSRPPALGAAKQLGSPQTRLGGKAPGHGQGHASSGRPPSAGICGWEADAHGETDLHAFLGKDASQSHATTHSAPLSASAHSRAAGSMSGDGNLAAAILLARQAAESRQAAETANSSNGGSNSNSNSSPLPPTFGPASGGHGAHGGSSQRHLRWSVGGREGPGGAAGAGAAGRGGGPAERKRGSAPGMPTGAGLELVGEAGEEEGAGGRAGGGGRAGADPDDDLDLLQQELEGEGLVVVQYDPGSDGEDMPRGPADGTSGPGALGRGAGGGRGGGAGAASKGMSLLDSDDEGEDGEGDEGYQDLMTADDSELFGTGGGEGGEGEGQSRRQGGSGSGSGSGSGRSSGGVRGVAAEGRGEALKRGLQEGRHESVDEQLAGDDEGSAEYGAAFNTGGAARVSVDGPGELQLQQLQQDAGMGTGPTSPLYAQQTVQYQQYLQQQQQQNRSLGRRISGQPPQQHHYQLAHTLYHTPAQGAAGLMGHGPQGQAQAHGGGPQRTPGVHTMHLGDVLPRRPQQLYAPLMRPITTGRSRSPVRGSGYMVRQVASPPRFPGHTPTHGSQPHPHLHASQHPGHRHDPQTPQQHHNPGASGFPPPPPAPALPPTSSRSSSASSTHNPHAPGPGSATAHQDAPDGPSQPSPRRQANSVTHSSVGGGFHATVWPAPAHGLLRFPSSSLQHHLSTMAGGGGGGHTYRSTPISSGGAGTGLEGTVPAAATAAGHAANGGWGPATGTPWGGHSPSRGHGNVRAVGRVTSAQSASQHGPHHPRSHHHHHHQAAAAHGSRPATSPPSRRQAAHSHPPSAPDPAAADMPLHPRRPVEGALADNGHDTHPAGGMAPAPALAHPTRAASALPPRGPMVPSLPAYRHYTPRHCGFNHSRSVPGAGLGSGALGPAGGEAGGSAGGSTGPMYGGSAFSGSRAKATDDRLKAALLSKVLASAAAKEQRQQQQQHPDGGGVRTEPAEGLLSLPSHVTHHSQNQNQSQHPAGVPLRDGGSHHALQPTSLGGVPELAFGAPAGAAAGTGTGSVQLGRTRSLGRRLGNVPGSELPDMGVPLMSGAGARGV